MVAHPSSEFRIGDDVARDGMFIELDVIDGDDRRTVCEIFYSDQRRTFTFTAYEPAELPLERIEEFITTARARLPRGA